MPESSIGAGFFVESDAPLEHKNVIRKAFIDSLPVCFGYLPMGTAYGILLVQAGFHWIYALVSALLMFAGSGQYLSVQLLCSHSALPQTFFASLFLNIRHIFYGLSLIDRYKGYRPLARFYTVFGLTDETYSLITSHRLNRAAADRIYAFWVTLFNQLYWIVGCAAGALLGSTLKVQVHGLEFVLTAVFVVLLVEQIRKSTAKLQVYLSVCLGAFAAMAAVAVSTEHMLLIALSTTAGVLLLSSRRSGTTASTPLEVKEPIGP